MQNAEILALAGLRVDGRRENEIRSIKYKFGVIPMADGSVYFEQGLNKVLVIVHGPQESHNSGGYMNNVGANAGENGILSISFETAPTSGTERKKRRAGDRRTVEMETILRQTLEEVIMLELYPKSEINLVVHILESDGSIICTALNAACLALMISGISMSDMITACSIGILKNDRVCLDCTQVEQTSGGAFLPIAIKTRSEEVVMLQLDSRLSLDLLESALGSAMEGCRMVRRVLEDGLKDFMGIRHPSPIAESA